MSRGKTVPGTGKSSAREHTKRKEVRLGRSHRKKRATPKRILVVCEDSESAVNYLTDLIRDKFFKKQHQINVVKSHFGTDPNNVVNSAVAIFNAEQRSEKKGGTPYEAVYCLFDGDSAISFSRKESFQKAISRLQGNLFGEKISCSSIVTTPCLEYWFLLHFGFFEPPYNDCDGLIDNELRMKSKMDDYGKGNKQIFDLLESCSDGWEKAEERALQVGVSSNLIQPKNPSTQLPTLLKAIRAL
ncbi:MAG: RloB domain-containing protein [Magnetococcales bacterium]|nr:RloB domain-containing protein [Magnetococcales bacterium]